MRRYRRVAERDGAEVLPGHGVVFGDPAILREPFGIRSRHGERCPGGGRRQSHSRLSHLRLSAGDSAAEERTESAEGLVPAAAQRHPPAPAAPRGHIFDESQRSGRSSAVGPAPADAGGHGQRKAAETAVVAYALRRQTLLAHPSAVDLPGNGAGSLFGVYGRGSPAARRRQRRTLVDRLQRRLLGEALRSAARARALFPPPARRPDLAHWQIPQCHQTVRYQSII